MTRILVVEDEESISDPLSYLLEREGYEVEVTGDGRAGLAAFDRAGADLVLLDLMLPGLPGTDVCRALRARSSVPVIMLTAKDSEIDKVVGLEMGADDYVIKPYAVAELLARVRAQLRRVRPSTVGQVLEHDDIALDAETHRVTRGGHPVKLGPTEFRLLTVLMEKPGRVWSREQLLDRVWGRDVYVDTRTVDVHVGRLRKALMAEGGGDPLRTVRGAGYALG